MASRRVRLAAAATCLAVLGGIVGGVVMAAWPRSATLEVDVGGWTLPVRGRITFDPDDVPSNRWIGLPWERGEDVFVTAGTVARVTPAAVTISPYDGSRDRVFVVPADASVYRGILPDTEASLREGDAVIVFSTDQQTARVVLVGGRPRIFGRAPAGRAFAGRFATEGLAA